MKMESVLLDIVSLGLSPFTKKFFAKINSNSDVNKTLSLYSKDKFTKIRFWDAPFIEVEKLVTKKGNITDIGCGEGIFTNFLAVSSRDRKVLGVEIDQNRFEKASKVSKNLDNVTFKKGDATKVSIPQSDNIILFHLLHHLKSFDDQETTIKNCLSSLKNGGKLIIVEVDQKFSWKFFVSWYVDCFLVPWIFEKRFYTPVHYRSKNSWLKLLTSLGVSCKVSSVEKEKPFTHIILECKK